MPLSRAHNISRSSDFLKRSIFMAETVFNPINKNHRTNFEIQSDKASMEVSVILLLMYYSKPTIENCSLRNKFEHWDLFREGIILDQTRYSRTQISEENKILPLPKLIHFIGKNTLLAAFIDFSIKTQNQRFSYSLSYSLCI